MPPDVLADLFIVCSIVMSVALWPAGTDDLETVNPLSGSRFAASGSSAYR